MVKITVFCILLLVALAAAARAFCAEAPIAAEVRPDKFPALKDATILIIRHAEKPQEGTGLSVTGEERARRYADYFKHFKVDSEPVKLDCIFAAADSANSIRPRLTVEPLAHELKLKPDTRFKNKQFDGLAREIQNHEYGRQILICWHHGEMPGLLRDLGADPAALLPGGQWPSGQFAWVLVLRYDHEGRLIPAKTERISEKLMPGDN